jgi:glycerophosphoryl diester phosphodiesterase
MLPLAPRRGRSHPFLDHDGPIAFAHRGGAGDAPENTLPAFEGAIDLGYRYLETDAHATRDGVVVAFHDACLDRVTDRSGAIAELEVAEVEAADAGYKFSLDGGRSFPFRGRGVRVPRLGELLLRWPEARLNIDPKTDECVRPLLALVDRLDAWDRICVGSFSDRRLRHVRTLSRMRACTSMGPRAVAIARAASTLGVMPRQGADCIQVPPRRGAIPLVSARFVGAAHRAGLPVHVWTVNDQQTMHELLDLGVDAIISDRTHLLADVFASRRLNLSGGRSERSRDRP